MKELLKKLVQAETTAEKGELAAAQVIEAEFVRYGIESRIETWDRTRANVVGRVKSSRARPGLLFACHLDVVGPGEGAWERPAFGGLESDGRIHGRGATDMKGGIAATVTAIRTVVESRQRLLGDIIFVAAAGEETDSCGAKRFVDNRGDLPDLAGVVIPEPTDFDVVTAHRGMLWLEVATKGRAAHGSTPHLGINAIASMRGVLNELDGYKIAVEPHELLGNCSMSVNTIAGGNEINVVPDKCTIGIDIRTLPGQDHQAITGDLQRIFAKLKSQEASFDAEIRLVREVQALETDNGCDFVRTFCSAIGISQTKAVGFTTDGPYFASLGAPVVIFGPGKPDVCHKPDEYIDISDVDMAVEYYREVILRFLT